MFILAEYKKKPELNGQYANEDIFDILTYVEATTLPLQKLLHNLKLKDWQDSTGRMFSAKTFLNKPHYPCYKEHKQIIEQALPFFYPMIVWLDQDTDQYFLVDGMHRLVHLVMLQATTKTPIRALVKVLTDEHLKSLQSPFTKLALAAQRLMKKPAQQSFPRPKPFTLPKKV